MKNKQNKNNGHSSTDAGPQNETPPAGSKQKQDSSKKSRKNRPKIKILFHIVFWITWLTFIALTVLTLLDFKRSGSSLLKGTFFSFCLIISILGAYPRQPLRKRFQTLITWTGFLFLFVELTLQILSLSNKLPAVCVYDHIPFGRLYCAQECRVSGFMNRYGWHTSPFKLSPDAGKIALIGDSYIEAFQINPDQHLGQKLQNLLNKHAANGQKTEILTMGISGAGPAQYLEMIKIAVEYYQAREIVLFLFLGNDFSDTLWDPNRSMKKPDRYIYYTINDEQNLEIHPQSKKARESFTTKLINNYKHPFPDINRFLKNHCMTLSIIKIFRQLRNTEQEAATQETETTMSQNKDFSINIVPDHFTLYPNMESVQGELITLKILDRCYQYAKEKNVQLKIVSIPYFPGHFYEKFSGSTWSFTFDNFDYIRHEGIIDLFTQNRDIPYLPMGQWMEENRITTHNLQDIYLRDGIGHLSSRGHQLFADIIYETFYTNNTKSIK